MKEFEYKLPAGLLKRTKDYMQSVVDKLEGNNRLEPVDMAMLDLLASSYDKVQRADTEIRKTGFLIDGSRGAKAVNPMIKIWKDSLSQAFQCMRELGLTVKTREQLPDLKDPEGDDVDPLKQILTGDDE